MRRIWPVMFGLALSALGSSCGSDGGMDGGPDPTPTPVNLTGTWSIVMTDTRSTCGTPEGRVTTDTFTIQHPDGRTFSMQNSAGKSLPGTIDGTLVHFGNRIAEDNTVEGCRRVVTFGGQANVINQNRLQGTVATSIDITAQGSCTSTSLCGINTTMEWTRQ